MRRRLRREKSCYLFFCMLPFFFKGYFPRDTGEGKRHRIKAEHTKEKITTLFPSKPLFLLPLLNFTKMPYKNVFFVNRIMGQRVAMLVIVFTT